MTEPGGERQEYVPVMTPGRELYERWLWAKQVPPDDLWDHLDEHDRIAWDALAASSVPVGGAPHPKVEAWIGLLLGGEAPQAFLEDPSLARDIAAYLETAFAEGFGRAVGARLAMRGAPRDDQNDDVEALKNVLELLLTAVSPLVPITGSWTHGYRVADRVDLTLRASAEEWAEAAYWFCEAHRTFLAQTRERSASASTNPSSGAAPKGEQEDPSRAIPGPDPGACPECGEWRMGGTVHACASPPPDRLTPEDIGSEELWRALMDQIGVQHADAAVEVLRARLADREPE